MTSGIDENGDYHLQFEVLAIESVDGDFLDPSRNVPFAALRVTQGTLMNVCDPEVSNGGA